MSWVGGPGWGMLVLGTEEPGHLKHLLGKKRATEITVASMLLGIFLHFMYALGISTECTLHRIQLHTRTMDWNRLDSRNAPQADRNWKECEHLLMAPEAGAEPCFCPPFQKSHRNFVNVDASSDVYNKSRMIYLHIFYNMYIYIMYRSTLLKGRTCHTCKPFAIVTALVFHLLDWFLHVYLLSTRHPTTIKEFSSTSPLGSLMFIAWWDDGSSLSIPYLQCFKTMQLSRLGWIKELALISISLC